MGWPKAEQLLAERAWFKRTTEEVGWKCGGSLISGRRTHSRNLSIGGHPQSLHKEGLAEDWVFDDAVGYGNAWETGRKAGLHGYKKPESLGIHWQARAVKRLK